MTLPKQLKLIVHGRPSFMYSDLNQQTNNKLGEGAGNG